MILKIKNNKYNIDPFEIINFLIDGNFLIEKNIYNRDYRYSRHYLFYNLSGINPVEMQNKLKSKHVLVLGCGGIGNAISVTLATAGIGKLTLVDTDDIELSNLTRQIMFTENDVGKNKIEILKKELQQRNSEIIIDILDLKISKYDDLKKIPKSDLVVLSADKPANLINWINKYGVINNIPYINVGYVLDIAVWGPLVIPGETGCWECQSIVTTFENQNEEIKNMCYEINKNFQAPSIGSINMMTASYATLDILKYLGEFGKITSKNKRIGIWTHNLEIEYQDCSKNKECKICSKVY